MTTIKIKFRRSAVEGREGSLFYQIIHQQIARQITTGYKLFPHEWNKHTEEVILPSSGKGRRRHLLEIKEKLRKDTRRIRKIIAEQEGRQQAYTAEDVVAAYLAPKKKDSFFSFMEGVIRQLKSIGKIRLSETYRTTLNSFVRFRCSEDILLEKVDSDLMVAYEAYLKSEDVCANSSSFYMRCLRAVYNRAVEQGLTPQRHPFKHVYTSIDKTTKRAISLTEIRQIKELDLSQNPGQDFARDLFILSFYLRGCAFVDLAYLKKKDLHDGILSYRRRKTGQQLFIRWEKCMQEILDKYDITNSPYLLPIIKNPGKDERRQYLNASHWVNNQLKKIGRKLKIAAPLTIYRARHAWASIARSKNIPLSVISQSMGHDSEVTTQIYLSTLDSSVVDKANYIILGSL